jgi:hypothetical protein
MNNSGQLFSWVWVVVVAVVALAVWSVLYIVVNESQATMHDQAILNGVDAENLNFFEQLLGISPFVILASAALFIWTTAAASGGQ